MAQTPEAQVVTEDVAELLRRHIRQRSEDEGETVEVVAEKATTSTRTVYRVLSISTPTINLDLADRLLLAVDESLIDCRTVSPDA